MAKTLEDMRRRLGGKCLLAVVISDLYKPKGLERTNAFWNEFGRGKNQNTITPNNLGFQLAKYEATNNSTQHIGDGNEW